MRPLGRHATVTVLGTTQTLSWASSYYLPAMLAGAMAQSLGISVQAVFGGFSAALILSALLGPISGRCIDRWGGRPVLMITNVVFAVGIAGLGLSTHPWVFFLCWMLIGVGMGSGLYEAAFSALVRLYGTESRSAITGVTLFAGFASTVGWPFSAWLEVEYGWRTACFAWAALHLFVGLPLNALIPRATARAVAVSPPAGAGASVTGVVSSEAPPSPAPDSDRARRLRQSSLLMAFVFAVGWFISTAMAAHLPQLLQSGGLSLASAVALAALVGPAQVAGRLMEFTMLRHIHPLLSAKIASLAHPIGATLLLALGGPAAWLFTVLHGAGNGILTIAKGTLPLVVFGPEGYGSRQGWLMVPARIAQATSPFIFGLLISRWGFKALWVSSALGLLTFVALIWLSRLHDSLHGEAPAP